MEEFMTFLGFVAVVVMYFYVVYELNKPEDEESKRALNKSVTLTSLGITISRFFDKNDWGSK